jgi:hypothetical protein
VLQAVKAQILAQEAEEEEKFRQRMLQKFADDEKTEQMANDKRRMRVQAHKKAVEELIVKRREERAAAKAAEVADINDQKERERLLRETIEKERQRILGEHAARLGLDFLPRGLLANQVCGNCELRLRVVCGGAAAAHVYALKLGFLLVALLSF